jgi:HK97 gp10 family phage protein
MSTIRGLDATLEAMRQAQREIERKVEGKVAQIAYEIHAEAVSNVPVDTGQLKQSGRVELKSKLTAAITFNAKHAPYIEFGTGANVKVPVEWGDYALQFKGKGIKTVNLHARPFLIPAFDKGEKKLKKEVKVIADTNRTL